MNMRNLFTAALFSLSLLVPVSGRAQTVSHFEQVVLVIDASGSMNQNRLNNGKLYWSMAKDLSAKLLTTISAETQTDFGLVHFGANQPSFGVCTTELAQPLGKGTPQNAKKAISIVNRWKPNGKTSLARGLELAWTQLDSTGGMIVVFTDLERDNCNGDPCATVRRLTEARGANKPPIEIRYVVSVGNVGFKTTRAFADCSGSETLSATKDDDIQDVVDRIMDHLRPPAIGKVSFSISALDPTNLGAQLPQSAVATLKSASSNPVSLSNGTSRQVNDTSAKVDVLMPFSQRFDSGLFEVAPGTTTQVQTFYTPPLVQLSLPPSASTNDTKWAITHVATGTVKYFQGPIVEQYMLTGDYDVEVWSGELYLKRAFTAEWNSFSQHRLVP
jgi:hypothetical protein